MIDMRISEPTVLEMLADNGLCEVDAANNTAILMNNGIAEPFEDVFVVFIRGDVVWPNKVVHKIEMHELIVDRGRRGKGCNISQV